MRIPGGGNLGARCGLGFRHRRLRIYRISGFWFLEVRVNFLNFRAQKHRGVLGVQP